MKLKHAILGLIPALALASASANAAVTIVPIDGPFPAHTHFDTTFASPGFTVVTADFGATTIGANKAFDYKFTFSLPLSGGGSGSLSSSISSPSSALVITSVIIDGTTFSVPAGVSGQSLVVGNFPIPANTLDYFEVIGHTGPSAMAGIFSGNVTFNATVPEPATWATFLLGFGFLGLGLRRRTSAAFARA